MPRHCSAGGCKSRDNRETRSAGVTFHKLPKGAPRRTLWITNSHRAHSWDPQTDFVYFCSKHFTPDSFELTGCSGIRRLKEDAFPTVFNYSTTTRCKRPGTSQPARKSLRSGDQEDAQQQTDRRGASAAEDTSENSPASSQEPPAVERERSPPAAPASRPLSPSCFMRRLPPPPGFYLPKEHSYAQLCPLLWRRRYDQAIDCLEKTLRQLHAARRRENRLRSAVLRLRDKRLKLSLPAPQDGFKTRTWTERRRGRGGSHQEDSDEVTDAKPEDAGLVEDRCDTSSWSEEEKGYCFYCGRGQGSKAGTDVQPTEETLTSVDKDVQTGRTNPPGGCLTDQQNVCEGQAGGRSQEQQLDLQQLLWIQDSAEGQVLLVPVSAQEGSQSFVRVERADEAQTILDVKGDLDSRGVSRGQDAHSDQRSAPVEMGEDVREKLKEHLEGFHLQLSTEFRN